MKITVEGPPNAVGRISLDFSQLLGEANGSPLTVQDLLSQIEQKTKYDASRLFLHSRSENENDRIIPSKGGTTFVEGGSPLTRDDTIEEQSEKAEEFVAFSEKATFFRKDTTLESIGIFDKSTVRVFVLLAKSWAPLDCLAYAVTK